MNVAKKKSQNTQKQAGSLLKTCREPKFIKSCWYTQFFITHNWAWQRLISKTKTRRYTKLRKARERTDKRWRWVLWISERMIIRDLKMINLWRDSLSWYLDDLAQLVDCSTSQIFSICLDFATWNLTEKDGVRFFLFNLCLRYFFWLFQSLKLSKYSFKLILQFKMGESIQ